MYYHVYVLWDKSDKKFYVGYTKDLRRRIQEHDKGTCHTTLRMNNPQLILSEDFISEIDARRREKYFKTSKGKKTLRLMLKESLKI